MLQIIDELQFVPKATAISLARQGVGRIGVLAPFTSYPSYSTRLLGVLEECATDAIDIVVFDHASVADSPSPLLSALPATGRLDGLIIMGVPLDEQIADRLAHRKLATVLVDSHHDAVLVGQHQRRSRRLRRRPSPRRQGPPQDRVRQRNAAFRGLRLTRAVAPQRIPASDGGSRPRRGRVPLGAGRRTTTTAAMRCRRSSKPTNRRPPCSRTTTASPPACSPSCAHAAATCRATSTVVGYDGTDVARALDLTTVEQPFRQTGKLGAALLRSLLADRHAPVQHIMLSAELRVGATS